MFFLKNFTLIPFFIIFITCFPALQAQSPSGSKHMLLTDMSIQLEVAEGINLMYNFKFFEAERVFEAFGKKYPEHPMPYFLSGMNVWWQIMPNIDEESKDILFEKQMDLCIEKAKVMYKDNKDNIEANFFLSASYALKARLYAERKQYLKTAEAGKSAFRHLKRSKDYQELSPELMFGEGVINYYTAYFRENHPFSRPLLIGFGKGDREEGLKQLQTVANFAFYTRTEAQYYLMNIYYHEEKNLPAAYDRALYLNQIFPDNACFQRDFAMIAFSMADFTEASKQAQNILHKVDKEYPGYDVVSRRYASYILGYIYAYGNGQSAAAKQYFLMCVEASEELDMTHSNYAYYHNSLMNLAMFAEREGDNEGAKRYYEKLKKHNKRKSNYFQKAKDYLKQN